ncbi:MAG: SDR family NAD(P)-dependent oxidoreductase [Chloroflexi bacterium]|nr:SDR family NAD(P)-dependent oxidoreductase [Chloroflexota bacterium]
MKNNILITGANRGLGLTLTEQFLATGAHIFTINRHDSDALHHLQTQYQKTLHRFTGDVTKEASIFQAMAAISEQVNHLDILINNAGVHREQAKSAIDHVDFSIYLPTYQINSVGPLIVIQHALPLIRQGNKKLIVNISSEAGGIKEARRTSEFSYCMSKAALNMASKLLQNALEPEGIKVLAMNPGWFSSDMGGEHAPITPTQAAEVIIKTLLEDFDLQGPIYIDPDGSQRVW